MGLFLLIYFLAYGGVNFYFYWRFHQAFGLLGGLSFILTAFLAAMVLSPIGVHTLDRRGHFRLAKLVAAAGYPWLAIVFWFFCLGLAGDLWNGLVHLAALAVPQARQLLLDPTPRFLVAAAIVTATALYSLLQAQRIRLREVTIRSRFLTASAAPIRIAQISDVHLGVNGGRRRLRKTIDLIRRSRPDLVVSTGDLVDATYADIEPLARELAQLQPPLGKFAVLGNHEYYSGLADSLAFHKLAGFNLLRSQIVMVGRGLCLAGVDDPAGLAMGEEEHIDEERILPDHNPRPATILLKHRPRVSKQCLGRFDLQLSGHTHGGQIFPFMLITSIAFRFTQGLYQLAQGSSIYVSPGTGTWGPPMRLLAPQEVTLFLLQGETAPT